MDELEQRAIDVCRKYISSKCEGYCLRIRDFPRLNKMIIECKGNNADKGEYILGMLILKKGNIENIHDYVEIGDFRNYIEANLMK